MKVYLAGPMRGIEAFNFPAFAEATVRLRAQGHEVFSPAERDLATGFDGNDEAGVAYTGREDMSEIRFDLRAALGDDLAYITGEADAVALLPGWEHSRGTAAEVATARALGLIVAEVDEFDPDWIVDLDGKAHHAFPPLRLHSTEGLRAIPYFMTDKAVEADLLARFAEFNDAFYDDDADGTCGPGADEPADEGPVTAEAERLVYGDRGADYGHPRDDYTRTGQIWSAILADKLKPGEHVSPEDAILCMVGVKISREINRPKRDNRVDMAGYAECLDRVVTGR